jgi:hypothetical protein
MAFDNTSRMQAIFDRENRLGKIESVTAKILKKDLVASNAIYFFQRKVFFGGEDRTFRVYGCVKITH